MDCSAHRVSRSLLRLGHRTWPPSRCRQRGLLTRAYAEGSRTPRLLEQTIPEHFDSIVKQYGDRTAVVCSHQGQRVTYAELQARSNALARGLVDAGVKKGDRVAVLMGNCMEYAIVTYSLYRLGAILVPLNPAFTVAQVTSALNHLSASHLVLSAETKLPYRPATSNLPLLSALLDPDSPVPSLARVILARTSSHSPASPSSPSILDFQVLASSHAPSPPPTTALTPSSPANIQFTSGTTSAPKAALLSHRSLLNNGFAIGSRLRLGPGSAVCCPPPLHHCFGGTLGYMACATHGATLVLPTASFDEKVTLQAVRTEKCEALYGVPTMFAAVLDELARERNEHGEAGWTDGTDGQERKASGFENLRTGIAAGSSVPATLMRRLARDVGLDELTICYGMTETSPVSAMTARDDPWERRVDSVGKPLPHVAVKVVDREDRSRVLDCDERGELAVSGYLVMEGYWGDEERTKEVMGRDEEGRIWMHTGDEATISTDGYVRITGRIKDLIIRGGENIRPLEIENCILAHPGVSDVSVVGVPDKRYGEVVGAFVIRAASSGDPKAAQAERLGVKDIREWARARLSQYLIPKYVFFVDAVPKTASGKVQKFALREKAVALVTEGKGTE